MHWFLRRADPLITVVLKGSQMNIKLLALAAALLVSSGIDPQHAYAAAAGTNRPADHANTQSEKISLTKSEAKAAGMVRVVENFEKIDANNDGIVTRNELRAYLLSTRHYAPMT